jgi:hypothetical protein
MITDDGAMHDIARKSPADLKPLAPGLSAEVLDWANELRMIWAGIGLSMNQFASLHPIDKGTISRYLNGQRVPHDRWFLDKLLAIQADYGQLVTPAVREHLARLQQRALAVAHPHEYRVRRSVINSRSLSQASWKLNAMPAPWRSNSPIATGRSPNSPRPGAA